MSEFASKQLRSSPVNASTTPALPQNRHVRGIIAIGEHWGPFGSQTGVIEG